jgi:hypothetical protein
MARPLWQRWSTAALAVAEATSVGIISLTQLLPGAHEILPGRHVSNSIPGICPTGRWRDRDSVALPEEVIAHLRVPRGLLRQEMGAMRYDTHTIVMTLASPTLCIPQYSLLFPRFRFAVSTADSRFTITRPLVRRLLTQAVLYLFFTRFFSVGCVARYGVSVM